MNKVQEWFRTVILGERREMMSPAMTEFLLGGFQSASGITITEQGALRSAAVYACVRVLAESVASLPLITYQRTTKGKERAINHALYGLLHDTPNSEMTSFEFRETLMGHVLLWGNAYAEIELNNRGDVLGLWPLRPDRMQVIRNKAGALAYRYQMPDNSYTVFPQSLIFHLRGLSSNGIVGYSPIQMARNAIGLSLATEEFGSRFFSNGARPGAVLQHPGQLGDKAYERLKNSWAEQHQGLSNAQRMAILEEGMKIETIGIPPDDAQFLETRTFQLLEIARIFLVPPHKIGELTNATFSNIENQELHFVVNSLRSWLVRWEQAVTRDLIGPLERRTVFVEFLVDGMLRGDQPSRYTAYSVGRQWGWLSVNDVRRLENMNEIGPEGDIYLEPLNMKEAGAPDPETPANDTPAEEPAPKGARDWSMLYEDAIARIRKRAARDIDARRAKLSPDKLAEWWAEYRAGDLDAYAQLVLAPLAMTVGRDARTWAADVIRSLDSGAPRDAAGGQPVININVPPQPPPVVNVTNQIPEQRAPVVNVAAAEVNIPAPVVNVAAPPAPNVVVDVAAPNVTINSPRIAEENQTIERDAKGNITSTTTTVTYEGGNQ